MLPVCSEEKASVDSNVMRITQTSAGHQARRRFGREAGESVVIVNAASPSLGRVVRSFASNHNVVHVTLAQAGSTDAYEPSLLLQISNCLASAISHARFQPADHLMNDHRYGAAIGNATFNSLRD